MGVDLISQGAPGLHFPWYEWSRLLNLAQRYGWVPAGTEPNREFIRLELAHWGVRTGHDLEDAVSSRADRWGGHYFHNEYQIVTDADARLLGDAVEQALPDIPEHDAMEGKRLKRDPMLIGESEDLETGIRERTTEAFGFCPWPGGKDATRPDPYGALPVEVLSGPRKDLVREFVAFCRQGEFLIG